MRRILSILMENAPRAPCVQRGFRTRPEFCFETSIHTHPDHRRTLPLVYFNKELPIRTQDMHRSDEWSVKSSMHTPDMRRMRAEFYRRLESHRWLEFRRKMINRSYV
ncbi:hypothetical protein KR009_010249 [Drosophila setifemur]|nr:hypothetical protein KR009_010249 [Drosophila setifemur]